MWGRRGGKIVWLGCREDGCQFSTSGGRQKETKGRREQRRQVCVCACLLVCLRVCMSDSVSRSNLMWRAGQQNGMGQAGGLAGVEGGLGEEVCVCVCVC